ncbi:cryptochrome/photolyase family protein [Algoriphagus sp. D3-2-R+10]|uniref:cryptochrome/photolyase family protein n=1 Tax=Algoriphagus aurantiacus TaxID=3103948 RepID=UPI002B3857F9|nr:cryptochrome/photolyase family protein [Algoriphagus sp. D3-2-R+10]MEB2776633.1 cryptochrome/photolyase family protein [Algoriphagus sp. D3-2-R+10]
MLELRQETDYIPHHIQKVIAFFPSMRNFAQHLSNQGHQVNYFQLDHKDNSQDLEKNDCFHCEEKQLLYV